MNSNKTKEVKTLSKSNITIFFILIYLVLFEFAWVNQSSIPKPSMLLETFASLITEYNLLNGLFETTAILFPAIFLAILIIEFFIRIFLNIILNFNGIINISSPFKYFSFFFFALLFNVIFPNSLLAEFVFITFLVLGNLITTLSDASNSISKEYIESAESLVLSNGKILSKVFWKSIKPNYYGKLVKIHTNAWLAVIVYEFIGAVNGVGAIYKLAFDYNDLFAIISLGIFIAILILAVNSILNFVISKLVFWE